MKQTAFVFGLIALGATVAAAIAPEDVVTVVSAVQREFPDAVVVDIEIESSRGGAVVSVENDSGFELYIRAADGTVVDRDRDLLNWEDRRIIDQLREDPEILSLAQAYRGLLEAAQADPTMSDIAPEYLESLGYDVEYRNLVIEVTFEGRGLETEVYLDPYTGEIISYETDD